jgi:hypothetical protein
MRLTAALRLSLLALSVGRPALHLAVFVKGDDDVVELAAAQAVVGDEGLHGQSSMARQEIMQLFCRFPNPWRPRARAGFPSIPGPVQLKMAACLDRQIALG